MKNLSLVIIVVLSIVFGTTEAARILAIFPFQARSHYIVYEPLLKKLVERGHEVVSISHFPQKQKILNFTDVDISPTLPTLISNMPVSTFLNSTTQKNIKYLLHFAGVEICEPVLSYPEVKKILDSKDTFDALFVEIFVTDCFLGIAHRLKINNVIGAITSVISPWANQIQRNLEIPSYIPNWFSPYSDRMSFLERLDNLIYLLVTKIFYRVFSEWPSYEIAKKHFGDDLPSFDELRSKMSLILANGHLSFSTPRPVVPGLKEIGGIHIPTTGPPSMRQDLRDYLDSYSEHGLIYFSFGSQVNTTTIPESMLSVFYRVFEQLPQQILWSCNEKKMPKLPRNVKCIEWAPQLSILCHPNVRLFITHGGLLGTQEAIYCGVPILGMPLFGDHYLHMAYIVEKGLALEVNFRRLTYERLSSSVKELLTNKSYTDNARQASLRFRDRPIKPIDEAVYWVEYVIRYGAESLKTAAQGMPCFCPSLAVIAGIMRLSENIAGVTILAFGNGAPDIFTSLVSGSEDAIIMFTELIGAGVFVTAVIAGSVAVIKPFRVYLKPLMRDTCFYIAAVCWISYVVRDERIYLWEAINIAMAVELDRARLRGKGTAVESDELDRVSSRPRGLFKEFLYDINPISREDWTQANPLLKFILVIRSPVMFLLQLFIPVVNVTAEKRGWSKLLNCFQLCVTPTVALFLLNVWRTTFGTVPIVPIFLAFGTVIGVTVFLMTDVDRIPNYHNVFAFFGFFAAMLTVYLLAGELMAVLGCIGFACSISDAMLGITFLAWGNSIGDLISNTTIARQGFPRMGYAACFGGPMFNTLLGLGLTYGTAAAFSPDLSIKIRVSDMAPGCLAFLLCSLLTTIIYLNITAATARRSYGYLLYSVYFAFILIQFLSEFHVIHPLGTDHRADEPTADE
ncbi:hypothetical protein KPH14_004541 [Odynerus spinipes]|uniref:Sodium/calcium exchanger membrane region domain-containing protein n=1 Tax=Odynerus spinipes TaxID=1348599 RepID=A0AAD9VQC5_9HYME|nr:hypothetical protein KPH14_004541 [Odynerus spinipes]